MERNGGCPPAGPAGLRVGVCARAKAGDEIGFGFTFGEPEGLNEVIEVEFDEDLGADVEQD